jgi:hypothetical protein
LLAGHTGGKRHTYSGDVMARDPERDALEAKALQDNELLAHILAQIEADAIERGIYAPLNDHDTRQSAMAEARAAREFSAKLHLLVKEAGASLRMKKGTPA